ncbi:hypothetical protein NDU88_004824 [Pleurodeles waltl]|uniref:Uncharacterized protein n=1 Tax=Pleurodeles waltl TaxID=8319 RepID=A0AAV7WA37_PLEWA|nr:hypothetical protein NDU88_004824 [Pleurodeles waltl]
MSYRIMNHGSPSLSMKAENMLGGNDRMTWPAVTGDHVHRMSEMETMYSFEIGSLVANSVCRLRTNPGQSRGAKDNW